MRLNSKSRSRLGAISLGVLLAITLGGALLSMIGNRIHTNRVMRGTARTGLLQRMHERRHPVTVAPAPAKKVETPKLK